jgi:hypothetical protein
MAKPLLVMMFYGDPERVHFSARKVLPLYPLSLQMPESTTYAFDRHKPNYIRQTANFKIKGKS